MLKDLAVLRNRRVAALLTILLSGGFYVIGSVAADRSYEALGSFAFVPLGVAIAGPVADAVGTRSALLGAGVLIVLSNLLVLLLPSVRQVRATATTETAAQDEPAGGRDGGIELRSAT